MSFVNLTVINEMKVHLLCFRCEEVIKKCGQGDSNFACCGKVFDPKPYVMNNGVCFVTRKFKARNGVMLSHDYLWISTIDHSKAYSGGF